MVIPHPKVDYPRVTHPFATVPAPKDPPVRLACVRHAASVRSEPGSNSQVDFVLASLTTSSLRSPQISLYPTRFSLSLFSFQRTVRLARLCAARHSHVGYTLRIRKSKKYFLFSFGPLSAFGLPTVGAVCVRQRGRILCISPLGSRVILLYSSSSSMPAQNPLT